MTFKRTLFYILGLEPKRRGPVEDSWVAELRREGYHVFERRDGFHWSLPWVALSGAFHTSRAAWLDASAHFYERTK